MEINDPTSSLNRAFAALADLSGHGETVHIRHVSIEQDQAVRLSGGGRLLQGC